MKVVNDGEKHNVIFSKDEILKMWIVRALLDSLLHRMKELNCKTFTGKGFSVSFNDLVNARQTLEIFHYDNFEFKE